MGEEYRTRQRAAVMKILDENRDRHLSAEDIRALLEGSGCAVGRATIYRCLDRLVEAGQVTRCLGGEGECACYQLAGAACSRHYHFKCLHCGQLLHVDCGQLDAIEAHVHAEHGFVIDPARTVFYGICRDCAGKEGNE